MIGEIPAEYMGPRLRALRTEQQRRFAFIMGCGEVNPSQAARDAGYSDASEACKVRAHYLQHDPDVAAAVQEVAKKVLTNLAPVAISVMRRILMNDKHPQQQRTAETVLDRAGYFAETRHSVTVEHKVDMRELEELARRLALENGIAPEKFIGINGVKTIEGKVIEHEGEAARGAAADRVGGDRG